HVTVENLQFGEVMAQSDFMWPIRLVNETSGDVSVRILATSCSCTDVLPQTLLIPANGYEKVFLKMDLPLANDYGVAPFAVEVQCETTSTADGTSQVHSWIARGTVKSILTGTNRVDF